MKATDLNLPAMLRFDVEAGKILLGADRMLVFRQDALGVLRRLLFDQLGEGLARSILSRFGYRCGQGDFRTIRASYEWDTELDTLSAGPALHTWEGIVRAEPTFLEYDRERGHFHMQGIWRNSYEAEIHRELFGGSDHPVCHSLTGYASGWGSAFFGEPLVAIETACAACGAANCEFEIKPAARWGPEADPWRQSLVDSDYSLSRDLEAKLTVIQEQETAISELSTPVMEIWDDILVLPIVGVVDNRRSAEIMTNLLQSIVATRSRCAIIDVTGVSVDTRTADSILNVMRAAKLLGSRCVLTGLSPDSAQSLVEIGADLREIRTLRNIKEGLKDCLAFLKVATPGPR
jgi:rsbT co-antagonist protein RsbR